ncbi:MAG: hypothetical protein ACW97O_09890 [Candidatus Thorarchaeota archaeon]|jgi:hypothetical protein
MSYNTNSDNSDLVKELSELGMVVGGLLALEHKISYGRWTDEDKEECHGRFGLGLLVLSALVNLNIDSQEPQTNYSYDY